MANKRQWRVEKHSSPKFGDLHICHVGGHLHYCLTDVCRSLNLVLREAEKILKDTKCPTREYFICRNKRTMGHLFVNENGLQTIIVESRKNTANEYRQWVESLVGNLPIKKEEPVEKKADGTTNKVENQTIKALAEKSFDDFFKHCPLAMFVKILHDVIYDYGELVKRWRWDEARKDAEFNIDILQTFNNELKRSIMKI